MEEEILNIQTPVVLDESIAHYEIHAHKPYASSTFNKSDEIRITVQYQDLCILPSDSSVHIHGLLLKPDGTATVNTQLVNNAICYVFERIRCEINAVEIDRSKNVGLTSLMKGYASLHPGQTCLMENTGWLDVEKRKKATDAEGNFDVLIPLSMILGFTEDYRKIVVNAEHELILTGSKTDVNAIMQTHEEEFKITINAVKRLIPHQQRSRSMSKRNRILFIKDCSNETGSGENIEAGTKNSRTKQDKGRFLFENSHSKQGNRWVTDPSLLQKQHTIEFERTNERDEFLLNVVVIKRHNLFDAVFAQEKGLSLNLTEVEDFLQ
ncbi:uncharacterized protein [Neodiprion pinetum]|uniref:uncharacterized protein n=1 Tax=Neodiprion pinetum TaxID=441929 RepID=UPI003714F34F